MQTHLPQICADERGSGQIAKITVIAKIWKAESSVREELPEAAWRRTKVQRSLHSASPPCGRSVFGRDDKYRGFPQMGADQRETP
jgi:hypothetical protein